MSDSKATKTAAAGAQVILLTLAAGQFLMALDSSVMNVSIATVAEDVGTTVTGIQGAITAYTLVMAMLMIPGAKVGALIGRKRAFMIGCVIYGCGSFTTALSQSLPVLLFGWSFLEGVGAALILPSIVALVAGNFPAARRPAAYGLVAAAGAIAIAVGPLIGGLATTYASWRWVFAGEVMLVLVILVLARRAEDAPPDRRPKIDLIGAVLCAAGLGVFVFGVLKSGSWGWVVPKSGAPQWFGMSPVPWLMVAGLVLVWSFLHWEARMVARDKEPLVDPALLRNAQLAGGLTMFFFQYLLMMGVFFLLPLYLSVALGLSAIETGVRIMPHVPDAAGGRAGSAAAVPGRLAAAGRTDRDPPDAARDAGPAGRDRRRCGGRDRDRPAAARRARHRRAGIAARRRDGLGRARRAELGGRRRAEHGDQPRRLARHGARGLDPDRRADGIVSDAHRDEQRGPAERQGQGEHRVVRRHPVHVRQAAPSRRQAGGREQRGDAGGARRQRPRSPRRAPRRPDGPDPDRSRRAFLRRANADATTRLRAGTRPASFPEEGDGGGQWPTSVKDGLRSSSSRSG